MKTALRNLTTSGGRSSWEVVYTQSGLIKSAQVAAHTEEEVANRVAGFNTAERQIILVLHLRKGFLKSKSHAVIHEKHRVPSLSLRHNLNVFLRNSYSNGDAIAKELEKMLQEEEREEKLRSFHIEERPQDLWFVLKEIKTNVQSKPVLVAFVSAGRSWEDQRKFYVAPLVDYESQLMLLQVEYDPQSPNKLALQEIFTRFKIRRVPCWIMATPVKRQGKPGIQITRFENFRDAYFSQQAEEGRSGMDSGKADDVEEAFTSYVLWGIKQTSGALSATQISI